jgi:hypothetical protein
MIDLETLKKTGLIVGYWATYNDNGTCMWDDKDLHVPRCPRCHRRTDFFSTNPDYKVRKRYKPIYAPELGVNSKTVLFYTHDNQTIASRAFRDWCLEEGYSGLEFRELPLDPDYFHFFAHNTVEYDSEATAARFLNFCPECGNYESVLLGGLNGNPIIKVSALLADGFYRTDLLFGSGDYRDPLLIVGIETREKIHAAKMKGVYFDPVFANPEVVTRQGYAKALAANA